MYTIIHTDRHIVVATTTMYAQHISANIDCSMLQPNTHNGLQCMLCMCIHVADVLSQFPLVSYHN